MTNESISKILVLLQKKGAVLSRFETVTHDALSGGKEKIAQTISARVEIINEADIIQAEIDRLTDCYHDADSLRAALINSCERARLSDELKPVFDSAQQNYAIINRASKSNDQLVALLKASSNEIRENLKQSTQIPKIAKFFQLSNKPLFRERT